MPELMSCGQPVSVFVQQAARRFRDRTAMVYRDREWTFAEFDAVVDRLAGGIAARLEPGARACVMMSNRPEFVFLQAALERAGVVRVPVNARLTAGEVAGIAADCAAAAIFHDDTTSAQVASADTDPALWLCSVDQETAQGGPAYAALLESPLLPERMHTAGVEDLCSINYTSGSSGQPKGVMLTHRNWLSVYRNMLIDRDIRGDDVLAHIGPLSHASGTYFVPWFLRGATNVIVDGMGNLLKTIDERSVTVLTCVPTILTRLVNMPDIGDYSLKTLRAIGYGAEPIPRNTLEKALDRFGPILTQNYGLTEAMMTCIVLSPEDHFDADGSVRIGALGRAYTFVDVVLRAPDGMPVAPGEIGEITVRSEHVMAGYWGRPEETAKALRDGWLWSGDLARMDEDGLITLCGRSKEMLISGGFNIYPQEVEAVLTSDPRVLEAAVIGVPDPDWGEKAIAFVSPAPDSAPQPADIVDFSKPILGFKTPKQIHILDALPKNGNGKVDKKALRATLEQEGLRP